MGKILFLEIIAAEFNNQKKRKKEINLSKMNTLKNIQLFYS